MANEVDQGTHYGNLSSYKFYMLPTAKKLYGSIKSKTKHHQNVQQLLHVLALMGASTTWEMTKKKFPNDNSKVREKEKEYRRLLIGRTDRGKHSSGVLEFGLVVKDGKVFRHPISDKYRLSLHGLLYCMNILNLDKKDVDVIAKNYSTVLPKVFGKWDFLKSKIGDDVYKLTILAKGLLLDNPMIVKNPRNPLYELMSYIHIKYSRYFESISENDLADQISLWFYTYFLYDSSGNTKSTKTLPGIKKLQKVLDQDIELKNWYLKFVQESDKYYRDRVNTIKNSGLI